MQDYISRKIDINGTIDTVTVKQYDCNSRFLHVTISDIDLPGEFGGVFGLEGCSARLLVTLGRDRYAYIDGEIADAEGGIVTFLLPGSMTQKAGAYTCEIRISEPGGGSLISTRPFKVIVEESISADGAVAATPQYSALENALLSVRSIRNEMNALAALAEEGEIPAGTVEGEVVDARSGFATLGAAVRACVKGENVFLNAANFASLFGDEGSGEGLYAAGNFNNVGNNKIYPLNLSNGDQLGNSPGTNISGLLITFGKNDERNNGDTQMIVTIGQAIYCRTYWNAAWTAWGRQTRYDEFNTAIGTVTGRLNGLEKPWQGLKVSVLGDSISTFPGVVPDSRCYYGTNGHASIASVNSMWWKQLCSLTGASPLVIEAWSGSCCAEYDGTAGTGNGGATAAVSDSRCKCLHTGNGNSLVNPDIIIVALGCNDYYFNVPLGSWNGHDTLSSDDTKTWRGAYANTLIKIHKTYPDALVFCFSPWFCVRGHSGSNPANVPAAAVNINGAGNTYQDYEDAMKEICELLGAVYIDVNNLGFTRENYKNFAVDYNENDGKLIHPVTHPNAAGQEILGQALAAVVREKAIGYINWLREQQGV